MKSSYRRSLTRNLLMWSDLTSSPPSRSNEDSQIFKVLITLLLLVLDVCNVKQTYRKSWGRNRLMWSDLTFI